MPEEPPLAKRKLSDLVEERLLGLINGGDLKPGDLFPSERELMEKYDVGRPAIREAMQRLQRMSLVTIRHGERPRVATPSLDHAIGELGETMRHLLAHSQESLEHLKQARLTFEMEMARIAARVRSQDNLDELRRTLDLQSASINDASAFTRFDGKFHQGIAAASGNTIFVSLAAAIFEWLSSFHAHLVRSPGLESLTLKEHSAIFDAIERQQPEVAADQMRHHLERSNDLYSARNLRRNLPVGK